MTSLSAAQIYIGVNIILLTYLAVRVGFRRTAAKISVGTGGDAELELRSRTHGNATEYIPVFLIGLYVLAVGATPVWLVHALGGTFTFGRLLHAFGLSKSVMAARGLGMLLTMIPMLGVAGVLIYRALT